MPSAFAYVALPTHVQPGDHEDALAAVRNELATFAAGSGYALAGVFTDVRGRTETGLYAMLDALRRGEAVAVVVPHLSHLQHVGCLAGADLHTATRYLRARLLPLAAGPGAGGPTAPPVPWPEVGRPERGRRDHAPAGPSSVRWRAGSAAVAGVLR